jgi:PAS domain S-box-containing protein
MRPPSSHDPIDGILPRRIPKSGPSKWTDLSAQSLLDAVPDAMLVVNQAGRIVATNAQAEKLFGYSRAKLAGKTLETLMPERHRKRHREHRATYLGDPIARPMGAGQELFALRSDGIEIPVDISLSPLVMRSGIFVITAIRDATERRRIEHLKTAEAALRESEQRFRLVANTAPVMIWMSGANKQCNYVNQPWLEFTGRSLDAELGKGWAGGIHPEDRQRCLNTYVEAFDRRQPFRMEYRLKRFDGEYRWILDRGVPRFDVNGYFAGYIGSAVDVTDHKKAEESLTTVAGRLIEAHDEERLHIARELHDDINQRLALLAVELDGFRDTLPDSLAHLRNKAQQLFERASEISVGVQTLSRKLHSSKLEYMDVVTGMKSFCHDYCAQQKVEITFTDQGMPASVPPEISFCLFRVMQEALHNAVKHSGVRHFEVEMEGSPGEIRLTVRDSGVGCDPEIARKTHGLGLISMRERVNLVQGTFSIISEPNRGTKIIARVPLSVGARAKQSMSITA